MALWTPQEWEKLERPSKRVTLKDLDIEREPFAEGNYGRVFRARFTQDALFPEGLCAVKQLKNDAEVEKKREVVREALIWVQLTSFPQLVTFFGAILNDEPLSLVMELVEGPGTLLDVTRRGSLSPLNVLSFTHDLTMGCRYLVNSRISHNDIRAANCLIRNGDPLELKITDFGHSIIIPFADRVQDKSLPRPVGWSSPEALKDHTYVLEKSDVYMFGCTLYEMLSGGKEPNSDWAGELNTATDKSIEGRRTHLNEMKRLILEEFRRPNIEEGALALDPVLAELRDLMRLSWDPEPSARPPFDMIRAKVRKLLDTASASSSAVAFSPASSTRYATADPNMPPSKKARYLYDTDTSRDLYLLPRPGQLLPNIPPPSFGSPSGSFGLVSPLFSDQRFLERFSVEDISRCKEILDGIRQRVDKHKGTVPITNDELALAKEAVGSISSLPQFSRLVSFVDLATQDSVSDMAKRFARLKKVGDPGALALNECRGVLKAYLLCLIDCYTRVPEATGPARFLDKIDDIYLGIRQSQIPEFSAPLKKLLRVVLELDKQNALHMYDPDLDQAGCAWFADAHIKRDSDFPVDEDLYQKLRVWKGQGHSATFNRRLVTLARSLKVVDSPGWADLLRPELPA